MGNTKYLKEIVNFDRPVVDGKVFCDACLQDLPVEEFYSLNPYYKMLKCKKCTLELQKKARERKKANKPKKQKQEKLEPIDTIQPRWLGF